ncbi:UNVERIFIED_CONTAM: hypothetical protein FKN15_061300 [Acipenser sinensis]
MPSLVRAGAGIRAAAQLLRWGAQRVGVRNAGDGAHNKARYRQFPQLIKSQNFQAEFLSSVMWFWILWHFWHDSDAVFGHFPWPDASKKSEELGIPADDDE